MAQFSIITASYNYENYIKETIESVINQTFQDWEMIIVDDGSRDNSVNVIKSYCEKDSRIKLYQHENHCNKGLAETLKLGISKAESDWIVFLESDDCITPDYLLEKHKVIETNPEAKFIFNDIDMIGEEEVVSTYYNYFQKQKHILLNKTYPSSLIEEFKKFKLNLIPTFSVVAINKDLIQDLDFNSPLKPSLDYYLWLQLVDKDCFYYINKKLSLWRMHKNSYIRSVVDKKADNQFNYYRIKKLYTGLSYIIEYLKLSLDIFIKVLKHK